MASRITVDLSQLGITWALGETYTIKVNEGFVIDETLQPIQQVNVGSLTANSTGPDIEITDPLQDAVNVVKEYEIEIKFNRNINAKSTGNIYIYEDGVVNPVKTYALSDVDVHDDKVYLNSFGFLEAGKTYYLQIDDTCFEDNDGFDYDGITNTTDYTFSTSSINFPSTSVNFVGNTRGEGNYTINDTSQFVGNHPLLSTQSTNPLELVIEPISNSQYVDNINIKPWQDYKLFQQINNPDPDDISLPIGPDFEQFSEDRAITADNLTLVVNAPGDRDTFGGEVYIYRRVNTSSNFSLVQTLTGTNSTNKLGFNIDISENGQTLVLSYTNHGIRMYRNTNGTYILNSTITYPVTGDDAGAVCVSGDGNYAGLVRFINDGDDNTSRAQLYTYKWNGTTFEFDAIIDADNYTIGLRIDEGPKFNFDGSAVIFSIQDGYFTPQQYIITANDVLVYRRISNTWTKKLTLTDTAYPYEGTIGISGDYISSGNLIYKYDSNTDTYVLHQTLNEFGAITKDGSRFVSETKIYEYNQANDSWEPRVEDINLSIGAYPVYGSPWDSISPDGTVITYGNQFDTTTGGWLKVYQLDDNGAGEWDSVNKTLTLTYPPATINELLTELSLDVKTNISSYDGEIRLKYSFNTDITNGDNIGEFLRYQRVYKT